MRGRAWRLGKEGDLFKSRLKAWVFARFVAETGKGSHKCGQCRDSRNGFRPIIHQHSIGPPSAMRLTSRPCDAVIVPAPWTGEFEPLGAGQARKRRQEFPFFHKWPDQPGVVADSARNSPLMPPAHSSQSLAIILRSPRC